jgi:lipoprotein-releasing system permease protein
MNSSLFSALKLEKLAMGVILLLIVVVAAFNIVSTLVMVVTDKTREIGIMKSMGLKAAQVQRVFMLQGLAIGTAGSALGAIVGLVLTWMLDRYEFIKIPGDVYFVDRLPVAFDPVDVGVILLSSTLISFVATLYPSRQAAGLLPLEAIRDE